MINLYSFVISFLLFLNGICYSQIPIDRYRLEIQNLKNEQELKAYWEKLYKIDQEILIKTKNTETADSISIDNMIRTALIFEIHGADSYRTDNVLPILNLSHNYIGECNIAFWSIIKSCAKVGGVIDEMGGKFPAYELESVALSFYSYSLLFQETKYEDLVNRLDALSNDSVVKHLLEAFEHQKYLRSLTEVRILNQWFIQPFEDIKTENKFEFIWMSDNEIYLRIAERVQKLKLIETTEHSKKYQIDKEPFGWIFEYKNDGNLILKDDKGLTLIAYSKVE